ncbi:MAG TPA: hypothetical protein VGI41_11855 [Candidatus Udaeobacter sp.]|jgi:hypothetical protein
MSTLRLAFFAICIWGALALPILLESAIFVRLRRLVVIGRLLDWLTTSVLACAIIWWWLRQQTPSSSGNLLKINLPPHSGFG